MKFIPYPCQMSAIDHAISWLTAASPGDKQLYSGPTGVGKSVVELEVQRHIGADAAYIVTPKPDIADGMLDKLGAPYNSDPQDYGIWTPITLRNRIMEGRVQPPRFLILDETHHHEASTWQQLDLLTGLAPAVGYTASPFRGTPKSTRSFRETWGDPLPIITYPEAIAMGYIRMPEMQILPLVDDDIVDVSGDEFEVTSLEAATVERLGDMAEHSRRWYDVARSRWDQPTIYAVPSTKCAELLHKELTCRQLPSAVVSCHHSRADRPLAFAAAEQSILALIHINVVQEGVDLKLRRLVDLAPCLSPVKWVQQIGRIMRPWDRDPEYVCTNRNILRHAYILEGIVPSRTIAEAEAAFTPTKRAHTRVLGLEAIGRFKPSACDLRSGGRLYVYNLECLIANKVVAFCCLVPPNREPIWACRVDGKKDDGTRDYGRWSRCESPEDLRGFGSRGARELSVKQVKSWKWKSRWVGLQPEPPEDRKAFTALPVLIDIGESL